MEYYLIINGRGCVEDSSGYVYTLLHIWYIVDVSYHGCALIPRPYELGSGDTQ